MGCALRARFCSSHALWLSCDLGVSEEKLVFPDDVKGSL